MKPLVWILFCLLTLAACAPDSQVLGIHPVPPVAPGLGGQGTDIGGAIDDFPLHQGSAWFVGKQNQIRYCVRSASPAALPRFRQAIEGAFDRWKAYARKKKIFEGLSSERQPTLELQFLAHCDGREDLTFLFAVTDPTVEKFRARFERPFAFAQRTYYDLASGWGRGFVWVDNRAPWDRSARFGWEHNTLDLLLLHEIGHVLGNPHVPGTVMDADYSDYITADEKQNDEFRQIDRGRELVGEPKARFSVVAWERNHLNAAMGLLGGSIAWNVMPLPDFFVERGPDGNWARVGFAVTAFGIKASPARSWDGVFETYSRTISKIPTFKIVVGEEVWFRESLCRIFGGWVNNELDMLQVTIQEGAGGMGAKSPVLLQLDQPSANVSLEFWLSSRLYLD